MEISHKKWGDSFGECKQKYDYDGILGYIWIVYIQRKHPTREEQQQQQQQHNNSNSNSNRNNKKHKTRPCRVYQPTMPIWALYPSPKKLTNPRCPRSFLHSAKLSLTAWQPKLGKMVLQTPWKHEGMSTFRKGLYFLQPLVLGGSSVRYGGSSVLKL